MNPSSSKEGTSLGSKLKEKMGRPSKREILEGSPIPLLFKLGWPIMISTLLQSAYNLIDTFWIGHLPGEEGVISVGAMSLSWPLVFLLISFGIGLGVAALALVSQHVGAGEFEEANKDASQMYTLLITMSVILGILGFIFADELLVLLSGGGEIAEYGALYLEVIFLGLPFLITFFAFTFILRAYGDTLTPMLLMLLSVTINIILDPILIFGCGWIPHLGIQGAAIATVSSRCIATVIALYLLFKGKVGIQLKLKYMKPEAKKIKKILKIGIPASTARIADALGFVIMVGLLASLPNRNNVLAAYGIGNRIINITFIIFGGLGMAMSTVVGQSLGADMKKRAENVGKKGITMMTGLMVFVSLILFLFRHEFIGFFIPGRSDVITIGAELLAVLAIGGPFFAIFSGVSGVLNGSGHTTQQMGLSLARLWALRIPLVFLLAFTLGMESTGAWIAVALSNVISGIVAVGVFRLGIWKEKVIEKGPLKSDIT